MMKKLFAVVLIVGVLTGIGEIIFKPMIDPPDSGFKSTETVERVA